MFWCSKVSHSQQRPGEMRCAPFMTREPYEQNIHIRNQTLEIIFWWIAVSLYQVAAGAATSLTVAVRASDRGRSRCSSLSDDVTNVSNLPNNDRLALGGPRGVSGRRLLRPIIAVSSVGSQPHCDLLVSITPTSSSVLRSKLNPNVFYWRKGYTNSYIAMHTGQPKSPDALIRNTYSASLRSGGSGRLKTHSISGKLFTCDGVCHQPTTDGARMRST